MEMAVAVEHSEAYISSHCRAYYYCYHHSLSVKTEQPRFREMRGCAHGHLTSFFVVDPSFFFFKLSV